MKKLCIITLIFLIVGVISGTTLFHSRISKNNKIILSHNKVVTLCGKKYEINFLIVDNKNIAERIATLLNESYEKSASAAQHICFNVTGHTGQRLIFYADALEGSEYVGISVMTFTSEHGYLPVADFSYNRKKQLIYSINEMDGSLGNVIGSF